jgi:hypothetical protein
MTFGWGRFRQAGSFARAVSLGPIAEEGFYARWTRVFKLDALARRDAAADVTALARERAVSTAGCAMLGARPPVRPELPGRPASNASLTRRNRAVQ